MEERNSYIQELTHTIDSLDSRHINPTDYMAAVDRLEKLADAFYVRGKLSGDPRDLIYADEYNQEAIDRWDLSAPAMTSDVLTCKQGRRLMKQWDRFRRRQDLDRAIQQFESGTQNIEQPARRAFWSHLHAKCLCERFEVEDRPEDADTAAEIYYEVEELLESEAHRSPEMQANLTKLKNDISMMYLSKFERWEDEEDLDDAQSYIQEALELAPPGHDSRTEILITFAMIQRKLWDRDDDFSALELAEQALEEAKPLSLGRDSRSFVLRQLAKAKYCRYQVTRNLFDKAAAFEAGKEAWNEMAWSREEQLQLIQDLSEFLSIQNSHIVSPEDLVSSIIAGGEEALRPL
jgi:tetratricopeptide (TPR) repeat protein